MVTGEPTYFGVVVDGDELPELQAAATSATAVSAAATRKGFFNMHFPLFVVRRPG
jgi:hypothetical protein